MAKVKLSDKEYELKFGINAYSAFEKETGLTTTEALGMLEKRGLSIQVVRAFIWSGLLHVNRNLPIEVVGNKMECTPTALVDYMKAVAEVVSDSMGGEEEIEKAVQSAKAELGDDIIPEGGQDKSHEQSI